MPNHVTTTLRMSGPRSRLEAVRDTHLIIQVTPEGTELHFDFETLIPRPKILDDTTAGGRVDEAVRQLTGKSVTDRMIEQNPTDLRAIALAHMFASMPSADRADRVTAEDLAAGARTLEALAETGYPSWYEWCLAKWGTKWNSYGGELVENLDTGNLVFRFETAWSTPVPVLEELARRYPDVTFTTDSYDEMGNYAAHGVAVGGEFYEDTFDCTDEAFEKAYGYEPPKYDDEGWIVDSDDPPQEGA